MISETDFAVNSFDFNSNIINDISGLHHAKYNWPVVYILDDGRRKEAYVGETTDAFTRMATHLKHDFKKKLSSVHLITSDKFNKSATLDIESNLIKYMSGDGQYKLQNANVGLANHEFYEKIKYWGLFRALWDKLRSKGLTKHSLQHIDNSDLFKYSPYKILAKEQKEGLMMIINSLLSDTITRVVVEGGAGTGKTILAIYLFKLLKTDLAEFNFRDFGDEEDLFIAQVRKLKEKYPDPNMVLVIPMSSFRKTVKKVFKNIKGLGTDMVIGPSELANDRYDIVLVDESHRLRRRKNLGSYFRDFDKVCAKLGLDNIHCSEVDWVLMQSQRSIYFYDENQSIKPSDARKEDFDRLKASPLTVVEKLKSQFRVKGGQDYITYVQNLLTCNLSDTQKPFASPNYEFLMYESLDALIKEIRKRNDQYGLARLVAGFSWEWKTKDKKNRHLIDIKIGDTELRWNSVAVDWINSPNAINEVGCIHTTQGYDLNYAGIIFGNEISYDEDHDEIVIRKENYFDKNGKNSITDPSELKQFILNIYGTIMQRGIMGTYIYVCDPKLRAYFAKHIPLALASQVERQSLILESPGANSVRYYDLAAAAGDFSELQKVEDHQWVEIPSRHSTSDDLFACRVVGESMNKVIPNGSICLFRKYSGGSRNGKIVLAQSTFFKDSEFGSGYTVKEYQSVKNTDSEGWHHESIVLKPLSTDDYDDIVLKEDGLMDFKTIGIFECVLSIPN